MYARSPRMDTLQVPRTIKIQPMDASFSIVSDDDEECGLGYQNTLVRINKSIYFRLSYVIRFIFNYKWRELLWLDKMKKKKSVERISYESETFAVIVERSVRLWEACSYSRRLSIYTMRLYIHMMTLKMPQLLLCYYFFFFSVSRALSISPNKVTKTSYQKQQNDDLCLCAELSIVN